jgi:hypothetical protein
MVIKFGISRQDFNVVPTSKIYVNPSSGSSADTCRQTDSQTNSLVPFQSNRVLSWLFNVCGNNKLYLSLTVKFQIFLPDFNQICIFVINFHESPQYQISRKSVQWEKQWYMLTDRQTDERTWWKWLRERAKESKSLKTLWTMLPHAAYNFPVSQVYPIF